MNNKDLENTRALDDLADLVAKDTNKDLENEQDKTIEISSEDLYNNLINDDVKKSDYEPSNNEKSKKEVPQPKKSFKDKWQKLSKKKKIIIISLGIIILLFLIGLPIYFIFFKSAPKETAESVILAKDNYIYQDGVLTIIDDSNNPIGTYTCKNQDANLCYVAYLNNNEDPYEVGINEYQDGTIIKSRAKVFLNKYVFIVDQSADTSDIIYLYNLNTNEVMGEYLGVKTYNISNDNYVILKNKNNLYGLFKLTDSELKTILDFKYTFMGIDAAKDDSNVILKTNKGSYIATYQGSAKSKAVSGDIIDYNDSLVVVKDNSKYAVYDYNNQEYNQDYDYIRLIDDTHVGVVSNQTLYIRGITENKYNESGYRLSNNNFNPITYYGTDNKKISTSYSFNTQINNNILNITIHNDDSALEEDNINLLDGEASLKYNYYNYFDGKLYFYIDEAKTTLIGTYTCTNKNNIGDDATLNNCLLAHDTVLNDNYLNPKEDRKATIPIYNQKYVFVYDSLSESTPEIKLYDLSQSKNLGTYTIVDSGTPDNNYAASLVTTSDTQIIAKLTSGKYGTIDITTSGAAVGYKFNYNYMERFGKNYLVETTDNTWKVYTSTSDSTLGYANKIMNMLGDYLVVKDGDNVKLYNKDGSVESNTAYKFIYLTNKDVFGAVDSNNKLYIITYKDKKILNNEGISLYSSDYTNTTLPAFKIDASNSSGIKVDVLNNGSYTNTTINVIKTTE